MFIDVGDIRKSPGQTFHFDLQETVQPFNVNGDEIELDGPVDISLDIKNTGRILTLNGEITGEAQLTCSRCLERYPYHLKASFTEKFCHDSEAAEVREDGIDTEDVHIFQGNRIDLDDIINESIVMALPMKAVCNINCKGLCTVCGADLNSSNCNCKTENIDPRLADLKKFFEI